VTCVQCGVSQACRAFAILSPPPSQVALPEAVAPGHS